MSVNVNKVLKSCPKLALEGSIYMWGRICNRICIYEASSAEKCPLCKAHMFPTDINDHAYYSSMCSNCDVFKETGRKGCKDTLYDKYCDLIDNKHFPIYHDKVLSTACDIHDFLCDLRKFHKYPPITKELK